MGKFSVQKHFSMASVILLAIYAILFVYQIYRYCFNRPPNSPPGPPRLPFVGSYPFLYLLDFNNLHLAIRKLCKYYQSNVVGFYVGNAFCVVSNDEQTVREVLFNPDFDGRNDIYIARLRAESFNLRGIFFIDGPFWQDQRRFSLRNMRDFGFGRRFETYELEVNNEMENMIQMFKSGPKFDHEREFLRRGGYVNFPKALVATVGNCYLQIVANERLPREEHEKMYKAGKGSFQFQTFSDEYGKFLSVFPWLRFVLPGLSRYNQLRDASMDMFKFMREIVNKQVDTYQEGHIRSFMDTYIKEIKEANGKDRGYLVEQLQMICTDFLFPSLSAVESQVAFLLRHLMHRQDVLERVQREIDEVVGSGRLPSLDDRVNMPYTEATLRESMRFDTLVPSSVAHRALVNTKLGDYEIQKDTVVIASLFGLHNSKAVWKDPENFRPERFLNMRGEIVLRHDKSLPFGGDCL